MLSAVALRKVAPIQLCILCDAYVECSVANVAWIPFGLNTCAPLRISPFYIIAWAVPLTYEMLLLVALVWNAMDRPRQENVSLARSLRRDGIMFMLVRADLVTHLATQFSSRSQVMASLRAVQLGMVASLQPANFLLLQLYVRFLLDGVHSLISEFSVSSGR
jgi:hypothetical protein